MNETLFPCILTEYYPIRLTKDFKIFICNSFEDIKTVLKLYRKDFGDVIRNVRIEKDIIYYDYTEEWYINPEENDWMHGTANIEKLYNVKEYTENGD